MTIALLAERDDPDPTIESRVVDALHGVELPGFEIGLDRILMNPDIALLQGAGNKPALAPLRHPVRERLPRAGILPHISRTEPHVTLGYEIGRNDCQSIESIRWVADRLDLVESWVGRTVHRTLASWPLVNRQLSLAF
ncbi:2'-5' RNA ligase [Sphingomonas zeicaulis]|uniref:2'-5' RNA ligase family protein n=1 Tax=Sphingomonas zeicaulis TaxID=1632740 RepID=UPI003D19EDE0